MVGKDSHKHEFRLARLDEILIRDVLDPNEAEAEVVSGSLKPRGHTRSLLAEEEDDLLQIALWVLGQDEARVEQQPKDHLGIITCLHLQLYNGICSLSNTQPTHKIGFSLDCSLKFNMHRLKGSFGQFEYLGQQGRQLGTQSFLEDFVVLVRLWFRPRY